MQEQSSKFNLQGRDHGTTISRTGCVGQHCGVAGREGLTSQNTVRKALGERLCLREEFNNSSPR
eukprot:scaffold537_cov180-Ochromonas_danica.AAC.69